MYTPCIQPYFKSYAYFVQALFEFDELKQYIQPQMASNVHINFLIGSGSSIPVIPTMGNTFNQYKKEAHAEFEALFSKNLSSIF
jgi:hypothetical protein